AEPGPRSRAALQRRARTPGAHRDGRPVAVHHGGGPRDPPGRGRVPGGRRRADEPRHGHPDPAGRPEAGHRGETRMRHWTEGFDDDDAEESLVRPYTITGGRTAPERDDLALITLVATGRKTFPADSPRLRMQTERRAFPRLCARPHAGPDVRPPLEP